MGKIIRNGIEFSGTSDSANNINYDNSISGLEARTVQEGIDVLNDSLPKFKHGVASVLVASNNYKEGEVVFDSPFESVPVVLANMISPAIIPNTDASGVTINSITTNGFKFRISSKHSSNLTIQINWVAMEF